MPGERVVVGVGRGLLVDVDVARVDALADACKAVGLDDVVLLLDLAVLVLRRVCKAVEGSVGVFADERRILAKDLTPSVTTV